MLPKPQHRKMRTARKNLANAREMASRFDAKCRDLWVCRRCGRYHEPSAGTLEAAHAVNEGMGSRDSVGCERKHYVSLCRFPCHRLVVHGAKERMVFDPVQMGDGLVSFEPVTPKAATRPRRQGKAERLARAKGAA